MKPVFFFEAISIPPPRKEIYRRLGFTKGVTDISHTQKEEIEQYIQDAQSLIQLKGAALRLPVQEIQDAKIILAQATMFKSQRLARFLEHCHELVLMGATAGSGIMKAIEYDVTENNLTRALVFDATASEMVDASLNWIMDYFNRILLREKRRLLKNRYSAGYGDLLLETQKMIYNLLQLEKIGIQITETCMLIPEKSVTAITGIQQE
jgi:hypothetical protein